MTTLESIYLACAIAGAVIFLIRTVLMFAGGGFHDLGGHGDGGGIHDFGADGHDAGGAHVFGGGVHDIGGGHVDAGHIDMGHDGGAIDIHQADLTDDTLSNPDVSFRFLSVQGISSFIMMFGIVGLAVASTPLWPIVSLFAAIAAGVFTVWVVSLLFAAMTGLQSDGTLRLNSAVGAVGTVYLRITAENPGKVQIVVQGALRVLNAVSAHGDMITTGTKVKVLAIRGDLLVVEPVPTLAQD